MQKQSTKYLQFNFAYLFIFNYLRYKNIIFMIYAKLTGFNLGKFVEAVYEKKNT